MSMDECNQLSFAVVPNGVNKDNMVDGFIEFSNTTASDWFFPLSISGKCWKNEMMAGKLNSIKNKQAMPATGNIFFRKAFLLLALKKINIA